MNNKRRDGNFQFVVLGIFGVLFSVAVTIAKVRGDKYSWFDTASIGYRAGGNLGRKCHLVMFVAE